MKKTIPCPECRGRGFINYSTDNSMCATSCNNCNGTGSLEVTMTNFDRIKAMSINELTQFLFVHQFTKCSHCAYFQKICSGNYFDDKSCTTGIKLYLESEVDAG